MRNFLLRVRAAGTALRRRAKAALRVALLLGLAAFYVTGALEHAETVNTSKARAD